MPDHNENVNKTIKARYVFCLLLSLVYLFPLLVSGHYYADDLLHSVVGKTPWISNGRPLSDGLSHLLMAGGLLNDIAPLTQMLGVAFISACIVFVSFRISKHGMAMPVLSLFPIISSPFFLENWSFRYDALTMSAAVSAAIIPYAFKSNSIVKTSAFSGLSLFVSLCFYQAAMNLFIAFAAIFFILDTIENRQDGKYKELFGRAAGMLLANALYAITVKKFMVKGEYNIVHSELASGNASEIMAVLHRNYTMLSDMFLSAFSGTLYIYFLLPFICTVIFLFMAVRSSFLQKRSVAIKSIDIVLIGASVAVIGASVFGPLLLLKNPVFSPRVLIGASGILVVMTLATFVITSNKGFLRWINAIPILGMFILAYSYYNAQRTTDALEVSMVTEIKTAIAMHNDGLKGIAFKGSAPHSLQSKLAEKNFPVISRIIFNDLNQDFLWGRLRLEAFGLQVPYVSLQEVTVDLCSMKPVGDFGNYTIRSGGGYFVVDYDRGDCMD